MPRIVYLSWPAGEISGGVKAAFQHVALLNAAGREALLATADGVAPAWFDSGDVPLATFDAIRADDVLVFPENDAALLARFAGSQQPKLVFCQNPMHVWRGVTEQGSFAPYGVTHILCVSHTVLQFCARRFPAMKLAYAPYFVDHARFRCPPSKKLQVACIPRKRPLETMAIRDQLRAAHPDLGGVPWAVIQNATEAQVAQTMADSAVFLSMARLEAHSMTLLEAMASGCLVAGFTGNARGNDSATAANGFWVPEDDLDACAEALARAIRLTAEAGPAYQALVAQARRTAALWRREEVARTLVAAWHEILAGSAG